MKKAYEKPEIEVTLFDNSIYCDDNKAESGVVNPKSGGSSFESILKGFGDNTGVNKYGNE